MISCVRRKFASEREVLITSLLGIAAWGVTIYLARFFLPMSDGVTPTRFVIATLLIIAFLALAIWRRHSVCEWLGISVAITVMWLFLYFLVGTFFPDWLLGKDWWFGIGPIPAISKYSKSIYVLTLLAIVAFKMGSKIITALGILFLKAYMRWTIGGKKNA